MFSVGDRVVINDKCFQREWVGQEGVVTCKRLYGSFTVKPDNNLYAWGPSPVTMSEEKFTLLGNDDEAVPEDWS